MPNEFPYEAMNPMVLKEQTFNSIDDVYNVLIQCYDKCIEKGVSRLGEALYKQSLFICNDILLLDRDKQNLIKKYQFCNALNCPPYPSLNDTPATIVDAFMILSQEINNFNSGNKDDK